MPKRAWSSSPTGATCRTLRCGAVLKTGLLAKKGSMLPTRLFLNMPFRRWKMMPANAQVADAIHVLVPLARSLPKHHAPTCVLEEFSTHIDTLSAEGVSVFDMRFGSKMTERKEENTTVVWLPPEHLDKNSVAVTAAKLVETLVQDGIFVVGDISPSEGAIYVSAFDGLLTSSLIGKAKAVVLITRRLRVCVFERAGAKFTVKPDSADEYLSCVGTSGSLGETILGYLQIIRACDSRAFWMGVQNEMHEDSAYLRGNVEWGKTILNGYLDFAQTLTNQTCQKIYEFSLWRLSALFAAGHCQLNALDLLTHSLVERFNALNPALFSKEGSETELLIGSIQVSGMTEKQASTGSGHCSIWHFFRHPDASAKAYYFLLWPKPVWFKNFPERDRYERVGRTPVIAKDGWKAYPMPRFRRVKPTGQEYVSVYGASPQESYACWQDLTRQIMKVGHWVYGGHHDLLTLNLIAAFDSQLDQTGLPSVGNLARFVYQNLIDYMGITDDMLNEKGRKIVSYATASQRVQKKQRRKSVLVYPSHPVTDHIINQFSQLVLDDYKSELQRQLIGLLPIRRTRSGSTLLISGLASERLERCAQGGVSTAIIFDDAMLTGRTYHEIKRLLKVRGFKNIRSLTILDRQRLPSSDYLEPEQSVCYWRLDVPPLGGESSCPLCRARSVAQGLITSLNNSPYKDRLDNLRREWSPQSPVTGWPDTGLMPVALSLKRARKKFGIRENPEKPGEYIQIGGDKEKVNLSTSTGLVAYVTEFHSMTSRDDLPLVLIGEQEKDALPPHAIVELIASQLLLFPSEFDPETENEMVILLMENLLNIKVGDRHTAFALLTLFSLSAATLNAAVKIHLKNGATAKQGLEGANVDYVLLISYLLHQEILLDDPKYERAACLLKGARSILSAYWHFHIQIKDIDGKSHSMALYRLKEADIPQRLDTLVFNATSSASRTLSLLDEIIIPHNRANTNLEKITVIRADARRIAEQLDQVAGTFLAKPDKQYNDPTDLLFKEVQALGNNLLTHLDEIHSFFYLPIGLDAFENGDLSTIEQQVEWLCEEVRALDFKRIAAEKKIQLGWDKPEFSVHISTYDLPDTLKMKQGEKSEVFVIWDEPIRTAFKDLLANVVYASDPIYSPWLLSRQAHLCVGIRAAPDCLEFELVNSTVTKASVIEDKIKRHRSYFLLKEVGGDVKYSQRDEKTIAALIQLPYANKLYLKIGGVQ